MKWNALTSLWLFAALPLFAVDVLEVTYAPQKEWDRAYVVGGMSHFDASLEKSHNLHERVKSVHWTAQVLDEASGKVAADVKVGVLPSGETPELLEDILDVTGKGKIYSAEAAYTSGVHVFTKVPGDYVLRTIATLTDHSGKRSWQLRKDKPFRVMDVRLTPDFNRDRRIDEKDAQYSWGGGSETWYYWLNDDRDWKGVDAKSEFNESVDKLKQSDAKTDKVDGVRDLIDYYPVSLDVAELVKIYPPAETEEGPGHVYAISVYADEVTEREYTSAGIVFSDLKPGEIESVYTQDKQAESLAASTWYSNAVPASHLSSDDNEARPGVILPRAQLDRLLAGEPVVFFVEHQRSAVDHLALKIIDQESKKPVMDVRMDLKIMNVESMYLHYDYRWIAAEYLRELSADVDLVEDDLFTSKGKYPSFEETDYPAGELTYEKPNVFVYVHGYNNNHSASVGSDSEIFKRLFWSGSRSRYVAISWYGYHSKWEKVPTPLQGVCPDYHGNVVNAFVSAGEIAKRLNMIKGEYPKMHIMGHSLGNMVVSSALVDHGVTVDRYSMMNPAVPAEAYVPFSGEETFHRDMVGRQWRRLVEYNRKADNPIGEPLEGTYHPKVQNGSKLFSWNWHTLFSERKAQSTNEPDLRQQLTWSGRFADLHSKVESGVPINLWSNHDQVFAYHKLTKSGLVNMIRLRKLLTNGGQYSWAIQEKVKGRVNMQGPDAAGWGFSKDEYWEWTRLRVKGTLRHRTKIEFDVNKIRTNPFFSTGPLKKGEKVFSSETEVSNEYLTSGLSLLAAASSRYGVKQFILDNFLALYVPSKSHAAGGVDLYTDEVISSVNVSGIPKAWPKELMGIDVNDEDYDPSEIVPKPDDGYPWNHGSFSKIPYVYTHKLYDSLVSGIWNKKSQK